MLDRRQILQLPIFLPAAPMATSPNGTGHYQEILHDINQAVIFSIDNIITSDYGIDLARQVGSEVLIRGWFKWSQAPQLQDRRSLPEKAHQIGALFGGGITCSALYDQENGITREQLLDMATRGPDGQLVDAWGRPGIRHGSLSSQAYLDYLFRWSREQIDAGADYLFMDENTAALGRKEGYDNHSLADFRHYLLEECPRTHGWPATDVRWHDTWRIDLADRAVCPDGTMASFEYRAYLRTRGLLDDPAQNNPLMPLWRQFREWRDDRAWKGLVTHIHNYARERGRQVLISANGLVKYADLQVLGVWNKWTTQNGHIDLSENQLAYWHSLVEKGRTLAGKRVPVVLFHDWGMGNPPFPWLAVPPPERETWIRTRGAEIYAAGAFFAFPVIGPFGCDSGKDGTISLMARQAEFHRAHRHLYIDAEYLGCATPQSETPNLSLSAWYLEDTRSVILHVINRNVVNGVLEAKKAVKITLPLDRLPSKAQVVSPDWAGERRVPCRLNAGRLEVSVGDVEGYTVAILQYGKDVDLSKLRDLKV